MAKAELKGKFIAFNMFVLKKKRHKYRNYCPSLKLETITEETGRMEILKIKIRINDIKKQNNKQAM